MTDITIATYGTYTVNLPLTQGTDIGFTNPGHVGTLENGVLIFANGGIGVQTLVLEGTTSTSAYLDFGGGGSITNFQPAYNGVNGDVVTIQQITALFADVDTVTADDQTFDTWVTAAAELPLDVLIIDGTVSLEQGYPNTISALESNFVTQMADTLFGTAAVDGATLVLQFSDARENPNSNNPYIDAVFTTETPVNPCFAAGTRILTPRGEVKVEALKPGDAVLTRDGEEAPIVWIGRREVEISALRRPEVVRPIVIEAGALGDGVPERRLRVSPDHALYIEGALVPAKALINWSNIRPDETAARVTYYHLELPKHDVIFAEGAPAESFLDTGHRGVFDNAEERVIALPAAMQARREAESCVRLVTAGPELDAIRERLAQRQVGIRLG